MCSGRTQAHRLASGVDRILRAYHAGANRQLHHRLRGHGPDRHQELSNTGLGPRATAVSDSDGRTTRRTQRHARSANPTRQDGQRLRTARRPAIRRRHHPPGGLESRTRSHGGPCNQRRFGDGHGSERGKDGLHGHRRPRHGARDPEHGHRLQPDAADPRRQSVPISRGTHPSERRLGDAGKDTGGKDRRLPDKNVSDLPQRRASKDGHRSGRPANTSVLGRHSMPLGRLGGKNGHQDLKGGQGFTQTQVRNSNSLPARTQLRARNPQPTGGAGQRDHRVKLPQAKSGRDPSRRLYSLGPAFRHTPGARGDGGSDDITLVQRVGQSP